MIKIDRKARDIKELALPFPSFLIVIFNISPIFNTLYHQEIDTYTFKISPT